MKTKGATSRVADRFPPATCPVDPKINALLEASRVHCSCVSSEGYDNSSLVSSWTPSNEEMRAFNHKNSDNLIQAVLATRGTPPRSSVLPKKTGSAPPTSQTTTVPPTHKLSSRQVVTRRKQKPSEFQHFLTPAEHISWYREVYTSCPTLGQFPHFSRTFHPSLSIAQANNTVSIDNDIGNCFTEPASSVEENNLEQPIYVLRRPSTSQQRSASTVTETPTASEERNPDHLCGISSTDRNFYPSSVTFQEPSNGFISSFFPKLHRSSYYRAHAQRKLLHRGNRLLELYPRTYGKIDLDKLCGLQYLQPKQLSAPLSGHDIDDDNDDDADNGEEDSQVSQLQDSVSSVDCMDQSINGTYSSFTWEVDDSNSNVVLPFSADDPKQQNPSLRMAMKKLSTIQKRRYTFPTYSMDKRQDSPKQFEVTGIHYTTLVSPMGTIPRLPKNLTTARQLARRRSKQDMKKSPVLHQMISMNGNRSASDGANKTSYTETSKHIFPFKNESEPCYKTNCVNKDKSDSQQRDVSLHNNCISKSRRRVLHKYLSTRLQHSSNYDRLSKQNHKLENSVKLGIIMPNAKESLQAAQDNSQ